MFSKSCHPIALLALIAAHGCDQCDHESLIQLQGQQGPMSAFQGAVFSTWSNPRDVAYVPTPQGVDLGQGVRLSIFSAVPSFGRDGNFIALLEDGDDPKHAKEVKDQLNRNPVFCTANSLLSTHRSRLRVFGDSKLALLCDWPEEQANQEVYDVVLQDSTGKAIGNVVAKQKPKLLKDYHVVACVRDIFDDKAIDGPNRGQEQFSGPFKQLVEWLEFSSLHGVDHFLVYTFQGTDGMAEDVLTPYLNSGIASRIHFQSYPASTTQRQMNMAADCLYRAKSHANWLMPTVDVDEYFHMVSGQIFPSQTIPINYLNVVWDHIISRNGYKMDQVNSIFFDRIRFARAPPDRLEISSKWREQTVQTKLHKNLPGYFKYVANVNVTFELSIHRVGEALDQTIPLHLWNQVGLLNHYRVDKGTKVNYEEAWFLNDTKANQEDVQLLEDVPLIEQRLKDRFGQDPKDLLKKLQARKPPTTEVAASMSPVGSR